MRVRMSRGGCSLQVQPTSDGNNVDVEYGASNAKLDDWVDRNRSPSIIVATGFIAKDQQVLPGQSSKDMLLCVRRTTAVQIHFADLSLIFLYLRTWLSQLRTDYMTAF